MIVAVYILAKWTCHASRTFIFYVNVIFVFSVGMNYNITEGVQWYMVVHQHTHLSF